MFHLKLFSKLTFQQHSRTGIQLRGWKKRKAPSGGEEGFPKPLEVLRILLQLYSFRSSIVTDFRRTLTPFTAFLKPDLSFEP
jgi:hypothetical protein